MNAIKRLVGCMLVGLMAIATIKVAHAKWAVEQVYSNANGTIQFIVFVADGEPGCDDAWLLSVHDGTINGIRWDRHPDATRSGRLLVATDGFAALTRLQPDLGVADAFLAGVGGAIQFCDAEFRYASLPSDGVVALDRSGSLVRNVATNSAGDSASVTVEQASSAGMLRMGHTGSWFDAATSGQGFEIEVAPDNLDFGTNVAMGWFTYDVGTTGNAERQRWYTLSGHVGPESGWAPVKLDISRNVGGNFDAPPITSAQRVGSATLIFTACDRGTLDYTFDDGRNGSIPITRLTQNVTCYATGAQPVDRDFALSGNWYDPATSGQGIALETNPVSQAAFFAWYTYAPRGAIAGPFGQRWYTAQSGYTPGARTIAMTIYETTGGLFDTPTALPRTIAVGTATLAFESCDAATLTYAFSGGSSAGATGAIPLRRLLEASSDCAM